MAQPLGGKIPVVLLRSNLTESPGFEPDPANGLGNAMRKNGLVVALLLVLLAAPTDSHANGNGPSPVVERFQTVLLGVMREAHRLDRQARFELLAPVVDQTFHLPVMMRLILGPSWSRTAAADQNSLVAAFRRMSVVTLASRFDGYSGETFRINGQRAGGKGITAVDTVLVKSDGSTVPITYATANFRGDWRIVDVIIDGGISEITVRRSEYRRLLQTGGPRSLTNALNAKADSLITGP